MFRACLLIFSAVLLSAAQERSEPEVVSAKAAPAKSRAATDATTPPASPDYWEVYSDLVIAAGKSLALDSTMDYSKSDRVAVTVRCTICNSAATSMNNLVLKAFWKVPDVDLYSVAEIEQGSNFPYWDSGGAIFQTFGSTFRLTLQNTGKENISIQQLILFRRTP